jgi:hypothetical protein
MERDIHSSEDITKKNRYLTDPKIRSLRILQ